MSLLAVHGAGLAPARLGAAFAALSSGVDPDKVQAGYFGMAVVAVLAVATYLLIRSFRHQMRKMDGSQLPHDSRRPHGPRPALRLPVVAPPADGAADDGPDRDDAGGGRPRGTLGPGA